MTVPDKDTTDDEVREQPRGYADRPGTRGGHRVASGSREPLAFAVTLGKAEAKVR